MAAMAAYPVWMGAAHYSFTRVAVYALLLAIGLLVVGPKPRDVAHNPPRGLLAIFSIILASGLTGFLYGIGYLIFG